MPEEPTESSTQCSLLLTEQSTRKELLLESEVILSPSPVSPVCFVGLFFFFTGAVARYQKLSESLHYIRQAECTDPLSQPTGKNNRREIAEDDRTT